ncbi:hypothetical protein ACIRVK_13630 [Streptomyces sp. NPDC101152]|uniref:hypothetical protein n=1 Tax=Streptomyces sp. NPDC101152 TaxID=3366116 RepID=UPI003830D5A8
MAHPKMRFAAVYEAGDAWLADCSAHPDLVRLVWGIEDLAPIPTGKAWLAVEGRLVDTMYALDRIRSEHRGPVLADPTCDKAWWLVPVTAAADLADVRHLTVRPTEWVLHCPPTGWSLEGRFWLNRPDGSGRLTDPAVLAAAFGPGGYRPSAEATS